MKDHSASWGLLEFSVNSESVSNRKWKVSLFTFPRYTVTIVNGNKSLWVKIGKRITIKSCRYFSNVLPQEDLIFLIFKGFWVAEN